jgi:hypothetical protein
LKAEGKRQLGRLGHRWEDSIKMNLIEVGLEVVGKIHLVQVRD